MGRIYKVSLCMKYDTCKRCPRNKLCELELKRQEEKHNDTATKGEKANKNKG